MLLYANIIFKLNLNSTTLDQWEKLREKNNHLQFLNTPIISQVLKSV